MTRLAKGAMDGGSPIERDPRVPGVVNRPRGAKADFHGPTARPDGQSIE